MSKALPNLDPVSSPTYPDRSGMVARKRYCANFITLVSGATMVLFSRPLVPATIHAGRQAISAGLEERHYVYGVLCTAVVVALDRQAGTRLSPPTLAKPTKPTRSLSISMLLFFPSLNILHLSLSL